MAAASSIKNPSVEICAMPAPFQGILKGGQSIVLSYTPAEIAALCPSLPAALLVTDLGSYAGPTDDADYGPITGENNTFTDPVIVSPTAATSGVHIALIVTGAADTGCMAGTEQPDVYVNLTRTVTWETGALTTQRFVRIGQPTIAFAGASTVTNAVTVDIAGAPVAGANATLTNAYALRVASGASYFAGPVTAAQTLLVTGVATFTGNPRMSALADTNGNESLGIAATASAINYIQVTNSATGNPVALSANGDDANVGLNIAPRGTGVVRVQSGAGASLVQASNGGLGFFGASPTTQPTAVPDAAGGATVDAEARTALNDLLARLRTLGIIAT